MNDEQIAEADPRRVRGVAQGWRQRLPGLVAEATDATPGVVRRESSIADFVRSLQRSGERGGPSAAGVSVSASGDKVSVSVRVSVDGNVPALRTAERVREAVAAAVAADGWVPASIEVTILDVG